MSEECDALSAPSTSSRGRLRHQLRLAALREAGVRLEGRIAALQATNAHAAVLADFAAALRDDAARTEAFDEGQLALARRDHRTAIEDAERAHVEALKQLEEEHAFATAAVDRAHEEALRVADARGRTECLALVGLLSEAHAATSARLAADAAARAAVVAEVEKSHATAKNVYHTNRRVDIAVRRAVGVMSTAKAKVRSAATDRAALNNRISGLEATVRVRDGTIAELRAAAVRAASAAPAAAFSWSGRYVTMNDVALDDIVVPSAHYAAPHYVHRGGIGTVVKIKGHRALIEWSLTGQRRYHNIGPVYEYELVYN